MIESVHSLRYAVSLKEGDKVHKPRRRISMLSEKIIGVWELQIWETVVDDRVVGYPLGEKASGFIAYHPIGFMSVNISAPNRVRLSTEDPFAGDPKLLALDAKGYLSYCGPFSVVSENEVIHHLKLCSFENWVGTDQHRHAELDVNKDTLILSTAPVLTQGRKGSNRLTWKRITSMPVTS
jgi:Lipocalin-like domain